LLFASNFNTLEHWWSRPKVSDQYIVFVTHFPLCIPIFFINYCHLKAQQILKKSSLHPLCIPIFFINYCHLTARQFYFLKILYWEKSRFWYSDTCLCTDQTTFSFCFLLVVLQTLLKQQENFCSLKGRNKRIRFPYVPEKNLHWHLNSLLGKQPNLP
jgi:hypothetical protein